MEHLALLPAEISVPIGILLALLLAFDKVKSFTSEAFGRGKRFALLKQKLEILQLATAAGLLQQADERMRDVVYDDICGFLGYQPEQAARPTSTSFFVRTLRAGWLIGFLLFVVVALLNVVFSDIAWHQEFDFYLGTFLSFQIAAILCALSLAYTGRGLRRLWRRVSGRQPTNPPPSASPVASAASR
jgi:hypothetical protein